MAKVKVEEEKKEETPAEQEEVVFGSQVEVHLDRDPNDPRNKPIVDGNSQPQVDINVPL